MKYDRIFSVQRVLFFVLPIFLLMTACGTDKKQQSADVSGVWAGSYSWNCSGTRHGSSSLILTLTQEGSTISGSAKYLNDVTSLTGTVAGSVVTLQTTGTSTITQNWFLGTTAQDAISGTTTNGENCTAPSGPSGTFTLTKQPPASGTPDHLALLGPEFITKGKCSAAFTIESRDALETPATLASSAAVSLSGGGSGVFYADMNCSLPVTTIAIPGGGTSQNFFFKDDTVQNLTLAANHAVGSLAGDSFAVGVVGQGGTITFNFEGTLTDFSMNSQASVSLATGTLCLWGHDTSGNFFNLFVPAQAGTFTCNSGVSMYYQTSTGAQWGGYSGFGACSVTVSTIGALGTQITGSFSGNLTAQFGEASGTRTIANGQFSVVNGLP